MKKIISVLLCAFAFTSCGMVSEPSASGDTNEYTTEDLNNLQDFILTKETDDLSGKDYDLNGDDRWDSFDVSLMREKLSENNSDILVTYFSCTGTTETLAQYMAECLSADTYQIIPEVPYTEEDLKYYTDCRADREQNDKSARPAISGGIGNMEDYDIVFVGYPIWHGQAPRIINTFLESYDFSGKTVIPFCTSASSGIGSSDTDLHPLAENADWISGKRFASNTTKDDVSEWLDTLPLPEKNSGTKINIEVNGRVLTATLENNSSAEAFAELIKSEPLTVEMSDYGNFEKVGDLPENLPKNDENITTGAGDIILYQGNKITIYYDKNTWNFTRLGRIDNITQEELKEILGAGNVSVTFSAEKKTEFLT